MLTAILLQAGHIGPCVAHNIVTLDVGHATQCLLGVIVVLNNAADGIQMMFAHSIEREAAAIQLDRRNGHPGIAQRAVPKAKWMDILLEADIVSAAHNEEFVVENGGAKIACRSCLRN